MDNFFDFFEIPLTLRPDATLVKQRFYQLSKAFHPDRVAQADELTKNEALRKAAILNDAYKTLSDEDKTMHYVLRLYHLLQEEEKYELPPAFLMDMMDLNEIVSDYEDDPEDEKLKNQAERALIEQLTDWETAVKPLKEAFDQADNKEEILSEIKDFYFRRKYLLRIRERLTTFASR